MRAVGRIGHQTAAVAGASGADPRRNRGRRLQRHRTAHAVADDPGLGGRLGERLLVEVADERRPVAGHRVGGQRRAQGAELLHVVGIAEVDAHALRLGGLRAIVLVGHEHDVAFARQPLAHLAEHRAQAESVRPHHDAGPAALALGPAQRSFAHAVGGLDRHGALGDAGRSLGGACRRSAGQTGRRRQGAERPPRQGRIVLAFEDLDLVAHVRFLSWSLGWDYISFCSRPLVRVPADGLTTVSPLLNSARSKTSSDHSGASSGSVNPGFRFLMSAFFARTLTPARGSCR